MEKKKNLLNVLKKKEGGGERKIMERGEVFMRYFV